MMASNMVLWAISVVTATAEQNATLQRTGQTTSDNESITDNTFVTEAIDVTESHISADTFSLCMLGDPILQQVGPYLVPFIIEYVLLSTSILYRINCNIGQIGGTPAMSINSTSRIGPTCHKSNTGLFYGLLAFLVTLIAVATFVILEERIYDISDSDDLTLSMYLWGNICLNGLAIIVVVVALINTRKLSIISESKNSFDQNLLLFSLIGYLFLIALMVVAAGTQCMDDADSYFSILHVVSTLVTFIQLILQTMFLLDARWRHSIHNNHHIAKYGRSSILLLALLNASMWLINTFELKELNFSNIMQNFYGNLTWSIIAQIFIPVSIFYRFQCVVSLTEVWSEAYQYESSEDEDAIKPVSQAQGGRPHHIPHTNGVHVSSIGTIDVVLDSRQYENDTQQTQL